MSFTNPLIRPHGAYDGQPSAMPKAGCLLGPCFFSNIHGAQAGVGRMKTADIRSLHSKHPVFSKSASGHMDPGQPTMPSRWAYEPAQLFQISESVSEWKAFGLVLLSLASSGLFLLPSPVRSLVASGASPWSPFIQQRALACQARSRLLQDRIQGPCACMPRIGNLCQHLATCIMPSALDLWQRRVASSRTRLGFWPTSASWSQPEPAFIAQA